MWIFVQKTIYLGLILSTKDIHMDPKKIQTVEEWASWKNVKNVQTFIFFANFYRKFVKKISRLAASLTKLNKKYIPFRWNRNCENDFAILKPVFTNDLVFMHFDPEKPITVELNAFD